MKTQTKISRILISLLTTLLFSATTPAQCQPQQMIYICRCPAGETYIITAFGKRYTFNQPSQVLNINGNLTDINFIGYSNFFSKQEK